MEVKHNEVRIKKLPSALDGANLIEEIPIENVGIDENDHHYPKKSPNLYYWMVNG